jgi:hypothetical protein
LVNKDDRRPNVGSKCREPLTVRRMAHGPVANHDAVERARHS